MDGIEKITAKIAADTQAEINALMAEAEKEAAGIAAGYKSKAAALKQELEAQGRKAAAEREERLASVAQLELRKADLEAKQSMLDRAFDRAQKKLCSLKDNEYIDLLARLLADASSTGKEEVIFSEADRGRVGAAAVAKANELLAARKSEDQAAVKPAETKSGRKKTNAQGEKAGKTAPAGEAPAAVKSTAQLTLGADTRPIQGGFILRDGKVEVNCAFETLVRLQRTEMAGQVAKALFGNS